MMTTTNTDQLEGLPHEYVKQVCDEHEAESFYAAQEACR